jgi:hypothetical protein
MYAFVHKKKTKYLCTTKSTRYYVIKNNAGKIIKDLHKYSSNKYKNIQYA